MKITNRNTGATIYEDAEPTVMETVEAASRAQVSLIDANLRDATLRDADLSSADLSSANLRGADLRGADLSSADLRGADLSSADLRGANLIDANLSGADLIDANLSDADLSSANLIDANLRGANLRGADLSSADLSSANLRGANLRGADLSSADLRGADLPYALKIAGLETQILNAVTSGAGTLNMATWHTCETTHCRAGWAIQFSGEAGRVLESVFGPSVAGALIYQASCGYVPDFHASGADALADIRARADAEVSQ